MADGCKFKLLEQSRSFRNFVGVSRLKCALVTQLSPGTRVTDLFENEEKKEKKNKKSNPTLAARNSLDNNSPAGKAVEDWFQIISTAKSRYQRATTFQAMRKPDRPICDTEESRLVFPRDNLFSPRVVYRCSARYFRDATPKVVTPARAGGRVCRRIENGPRTCVNSRDRACTGCPGMRQ